MVYSRKLPSLQLRTSTLVESVYVRWARVGVLDAAEAIYIYVIRILSKSTMIFLEW